MEVRYWNVAHMVRTGILELYSGDRNDGGRKTHTRKMAFFKIFYAAHFKSSEEMRKKHDFNIKFEHLSSEQNNNTEREKKISAFLRECECVCCFGKISRSRCGFYNFDQSSPFAYALFQLVLFSALFRTSQTRAHARERARMTLFTLKIQYETNRKWNHYKSCWFSRSKCATSAEKYASNYEFKANQFACPKTESARWILLLLVDLCGLALFDSIMIFLNANFIIYELWMNRLTNSQTENSFQLDERERERVWRLCSFCKLLEKVAGNITWAW